MDYTEVCSEIARNDPMMAKLIAALCHELAPIVPKPPEQYLEHICESIVSQQLSVKAADTIWGRTRAIVHDWNDPDQILNCPPDSLRACGLSWQKISYTRSAAEHFQTKQIDITTLSHLDDHEVLKALTAIKGVGTWTAEMFLIFCMGRSDVFSGGDLGLRAGISKLYGIERPTPEEAVEYAVKWAPYRSVASRALWKSLDNV